MTIAIAITKEAETLLALLQKTYFVLCLAALANDVAFWLASPLAESVSLSLAFSLYNSLEPNPLH